MADTKISDLTAVTTVNATDEYVLARAGATNKIDASDLADGLRTLSPAAGGVELAYNEFTSNVSVTATSEATANTVVTASAITADGSTPIVIEFYAPSVDANVAIVLYDGSSTVGGVLAFNGAQVPIYVPKRLTPASGSHTYSIRAYKPSGSPSVQAGTGGSGNNMPGFIRITTA